MHDAENSFWARREATLLSTPKIHITLSAITLILGVAAYIYAEVGPSSAIAEVAAQNGNPPTEVLHVFLTALLSVLIIEILSFARRIRNIQRFSLKNTGQPTNPMCSVSGQLLDEVSRQYGAVPVTLVWIGSDQSAYPRVEPGLGTCFLILPGGAFRSCWLRGERFFKAILLHEVGHVLARDDFWFHLFPFVFRALARFLVCTFLIWRVALIATGRLPLAWRSVGLGPVILIVIPLFVSYGLWILAVRRRELLADRFMSVTAPAFEVDAETVNAVKNVVHSSLDRSYCHPSGAERLAALEHPSSILVSSLATAGAGSLCSYLMSIAAGVILMPCRMGHLTTLVSVLIVNTLIALEAGTIASISSLREAIALRRIARIFVFLFVITQGKSLLHVAQKLVISKTTTFGPIHLAMDWPGTILSVGLSVFMGLCVFLLALVLFRTILARAPFIEALSAAMSLACFIALLDCADQRIQVALSVGLVVIATILMVHRLRHAFNSVEYPRLRRTVVVALFLLSIMVYFHQRPALLASYARWNVEQFFLRAAIVQQHARRSEWSESLSVALTLRQPFERISSEAQSAVGKDLWFRLSLCVADLPESYLKAARDHGRTPEEKAWLIREASFSASMAIRAGCYAERYAFTARLAALYSILWKRAALPQADMYAQLALNLDALESDAMNEDTHQPFVVPADLAEFTARHNLSCDSEKTRARVRQLWRLAVLEHVLGMHRLTLDQCTVVADWAAVGPLGRGLQSGLLFRWMDEEWHLAFMGAPWTQAHVLGVAKDGGSFCSGISKDVLRDLKIPE